MQSGRKPCPGISRRRPRPGHLALAPMEQTGLLGPSIYLRSPGRQPLASPATPRGSRQAGTLCPAGSGDRAARGSSPPGLRVLSGPVPGSPGWGGGRLGAVGPSAGKGWSRDSTQVSPGCHLPPLSPGKERVGVTAGVLAQRVSSSPRTPPHLLVLTAPSSPPPGRPPGIAARACGA